MPAKPQVLIAGAGLGGLVAALSLHARGIPVAIHEQAPELRELGAGVQIAANGSRVLLALGLGDAMEAIATVPRGKVVRLFSTGQTWDMVDLSGGSVAKYGAPYWMVHRGDFHRVLLRAVEERMPGAIHLGARCVGVKQDADGADLLIEGGRRVRGDAVIGADGVHSRVRHALFGDGKASFTGFVAWRGLIPMEELPERLRLDAGTNWIGPHGHVVMYPLRRGALLNVVAAIERDAWGVEESWTQRGSVEEMRADFAAWHPDVQEIVGHIREPYQWALLGREPMERWSRGRVTLLGDACHPTLPFLAQGANMAIEDGMVLARCLEAHDVPEALRRYEAARLERTGRIVRGAADNVHRFHNPGLADPAFAPGFVDREFQPERNRERYDYIFHYDALQVAV